MVSSDIDVRFTTGKLVPVDSNLPYDSTDLDLLISLSLNQAFTVQVPDALFTDSRLLCLLRPHFTISIPHLENTLP